MSAFGTSGHWRVDFAVLHKTAALQKRGLGGRSMRRREFTTLLAGAAVLVDYSEMDPFTDSPIRPTRQYAAWRRKAPLPTLGAEGAPKSTGYARLHGPRPIPDGKAITVPTGYSEFPREILRPPRSLPSASTPTFAAGASCRAAAILPRWSSPSLWRTSCASSSGRCARPLA